MKTRTTIIIVIGVVLSFCGLYWVLMRVNLAASADQRICIALGQALASYAVQNEGKLPSDWNDLVQAGLAYRPDPKESHRLGIRAFWPSEVLRGLPETKRQVTCTAVIDDVRDYEIAFGVNVMKLDVTKTGLIIDERDRPVVLMRRLGRRDVGGYYPRESANIVGLAHSYLRGGNVASRFSEKRTQ